MNHNCIYCYVLGRGSVLWRSTIVTCFDIYTSAPSIILNNVWSMLYCISLGGFDVLFHRDCFFWYFMMGGGGDWSLKNNDEYLCLSKKKVKGKLLICFWGGFSWLSKTRDDFFPLKNAMIYLQKILKRYCDLPPWPKLINLQENLIP